MAAIIQLESVSKSFSAEPLLQDVTFNVQAGDRLGLIGPNGAGKSTLLKMMANLESPDAGELRRQRDAFMLYTAQQVPFDGSLSVYDTLQSAWEIDLEDYERDSRIDRYLRSLEIDPDVKLGSLSGGWQKRVHLISGLMHEPDCWLVDEPTNHLDLAAVLWLQEQLQQFRGTIVLISHDRYFLNEMATRIIDVNNCYRNGFLDVAGNYDAYLVGRDAYAAAQLQEQSSLANQNRREQEWLARRPKARGTKSVSRIKRAGELESDLKAVSARNVQRSIGDVSFQGSGRKSQDLIVATALKQQFGDLHVFHDLDLHLSAGNRMVILGRNGCGKTSLLNILAGDVEQKSGTVKRAHELRIVRFSQDRSQLNMKATLRSVMCPEGGDRVAYQGRDLHINAWLQMFLFRPDQLDQLIGSFSGGEQARILLSGMMLREADVLILDEPTNDLDIPAIELLEQSLIEFNGAIILVTHDRYLMENVATHFLALNIGEQPVRVGSYRQWEDQQRQKNTKSSSNVVASDEVDYVEPALTEAKPAAKKSSLSWNEQKELRGMESKIEKAEAKLEALQASLHADEAGRDAKMFERISKEILEQQEKNDALYARWQDLESRNG